MGGPPISEENLDNAGQATQPRDVPTMNVLIHKRNGVYVCCGAGYAKELNTTDDKAQVTCRDCKKWMT